MALSLLSKLGLGILALAVVVAAYGCAPVACSDYAKREFREQGKVIVWCEK